MKKLIIILILFSSCASYNDSRLSFYNYHIVKNNYPEYSIKEFKRFTYIFDVYNNTDSLKVFVNSKGSIYKTIKLK